MNASADGGRDPSPAAAPRRRIHPRVLLGLLSVAAVVTLYTLASAAYHRPAILPPTPVLLDALITLVTGRTPVAGSGHLHPAGPGSETLPGALLVSTYRVVVGVGLGGLLGVALGLAMGWSRKADDYLHPLYVLLRAIPPLALITYVMLWFGHGEAHRLVPIVYAVFATMVIPTYQGVRDLAEVYVRAARALGAGPRLVLTRVVLPAASPFVLAGLRQCLIAGWMTTVGVEMLMADDGIGHFIVGGGLWGSRLQVAVDPAAVMVSILGLATVGYAMDAAALVLTDRLTAWSARRR
jgi:ABC-type nitrate/sulfonate/bicarbonate transport system permease component